MSKEFAVAVSSAARLGLLILTVQMVPALSEDDHAHDGSHAFEWAGIFETNENTYLWTAQKVKAGNIVNYADATMKMAVLPASAATDSVLHSLESEGEHSLGMTCEDVSSGSTITPMEDKCYRLVFKQDWWQSLYTINATGQSALAFFTEHAPTEFENTAHYLKDDHGDDIEPIAELPEDQNTPIVEAATEEEQTYWGEGILVSIIVNIVTLVGVAFLVPGVSTLAKKYFEEFECVVSAFAGGAISACAFFLLLFESTHLIATDYSEEVDVVWRWGTMILAGALFPAVVSAISELALKKPPTGKGGDAEEGGAALDSPLEISRPRLITSVLIGDFIHNMCDGFFVGAAFKGCGSSTGWTVAWSTIGHEVAQELSDYLVLTGKECKLHPAVALALNFLSGTGVMLGTLIVLATDISQAVIGLLLAFGGGVYLNIAYIECMSKFQRAKVSGLVRVLGILMFIVGAVAIGLVLIKHEHCVPPPAPGAPVQSDGHNHR